MENKMILVKSIEIMEVSDNFVYEIYEKMGNPHISYNERESLETKLKLTREIIKGQRFINKRGESVYIGMTKEVQDILGLPLHVFNDLTNFNRNLQKRLDNVIKYKKDLELKIKNIENTGFLRRLKYLFTGKLN